MSGSRVPLSEGLFRTEHDAMCPNVDLFQLTPITICLYCHVINNVRQDERAKTLDLAIETVADLREDHIRWYRVALEDAADALRELRHTGPPVDTTH